MTVTGVARTWHAARNSRAASVLSATVLRAWSGHQRRTTKSSWCLQSVRVLWWRPRSWSYRAEGASAVRKRRAQTRVAQGTGTRSMRQTQRSPLALTKCAWLECTASRAIPLGGDLRPPPPFNRLIEPQHQRTARYEHGHEQRQREATQHAVVALEALALGQAHNPQRRTRAWRQTPREKSGAKGATMGSMAAGRVSIGLPPGRGGELSLSPFSPPNGRSRDKTLSILPLHQRSITQILTFPRVLLCTELTSKHRKEHDMLAQLRKMLERTNLHDDSPQSWWHVIGLDVRRHDANMSYVPRHLCPQGHKLFDFRSEPEFQVLLRVTEAEQRTGLRPNRLFVLWQAVRNSSFLNAPVAEVGVYKGGSAKFIARALKQKGHTREMHLFDTFSGHPDQLVDSHMDGSHHKGLFTKTDSHRVAKYMSDFPGSIIHVGLFSVTCKDVKHLMFGLVHVDVVLYESTVECLRFFWPRLHVGGLIVIDDYGFVTCAGTKQAVDEFVASAADASLWYMHTGQAVLQKRGVDAVGHDRSRRLMCSPDG